MLKDTDKKKAKIALPAKSNPAAAASRSFSAGDAEDAATFTGFSLDVDAPEFQQPETYVRVLAAGSTRKVFDESETAR